MKRILKIIAFIFILLAVLWLLIASNKKAGEQILGGPRIFLTVQDGISLLTEKELIQEIYSTGLFQNGIKKSELKESDIEAFINGLDEVLTAHVYTDIGNKWNIEVVTRRPMAREVGS